MTVRSFYDAKPESYFAHVRHDVLAMLPPGTRRLLDVGCGSGATGEAAKQQYGVAEVWGIEALASVARQAQARLDRVLVGDVETCLEACPDGAFDCVVCADVLEHLADPWDVLRQLHRVLSAEGTLVLSVPNLRHLKVLLKIVTDRFEYEPEGVLDQTHLRFFTRHTIVQMLTQTGYRIVRVVPTRSGGWRWMLLQACSCGVLRPFAIYQYLVVARKQESA